MSLVLSVVIDCLFVSLVLMPMVVSFSLVFGMLRIVNLAHGEFLMLGGYIVWFLTMLHGVNYWLALAVALPPVIVLALVLERYIFRRYRTFLLPSMIVSVGLILILQTGVMLIVDALKQGHGFQAISPPFAGSLSLLGVDILHMRLFVMAVGVASLLGLLGFLNKTLLGRSIRACAQDPEAASVQGIDLNRNCVIVMGIGAALAALSGGALSATYGVEPYMGFHYLLVALVAVVVGGMGSLNGAILGAFIIGFTDVLSTRFLGAHFSVIGLYGLLLLLLLFRPKGLFGYIIHAH